MASSTDEVTIGRPAKRSADEDASAITSKRLKLEDEQVKMLEGRMGEWRLFHDARFSDITVKSGERDWNLHRSMLVPRCEFFRACCDGNFKEGGDRAIEMHDDEPHALNCLLEYIYSQRCPVDLMHWQYSHPPSWPPFQRLLVDTYQLADKYDQAELMVVLEEKCDMIPEINGHEPVADAVDRVYRMGQSPSIDRLSAKLFNLLLNQELAMLSENTKKSLKDNHELSVNLIEGLNKCLRSARKDLQTTKISLAHATKALQLANLQLLQKQAAFNATNGDLVIERTKCCRVRASRPSAQRQDGTECQHCGYGKVVPSLSQA